jgi:hypothetical protein
MSEARLRELLNRLRAAETPAPSFESVMTPVTRHGRLRVGRAALAISGLVAAVAALLAWPDRPPSLGTAVAPPTTDWLLQTPQDDWLTRGSQKEGSHGS